MPNNANGIVNPYGAGNVRLDSTPYTNFFLRQEAQKRAKDEALDKYYNDIEKNVTPAGMRTVDVPLLLEGKKKAQEYWMQNRKAIKNPDLDNGKSLLEYSQLHNGNLGTIQSSKNELQGELSFHKLRTNPEVADRIGEDTLQAADIVRLPLNDPRRTINAADMLDNVTFNPKRLTPQQQQQQFKNYQALAGKPDEEKRVVVGVDPNDKFNDIVEVQTKYSDATLKKAGDNAIMSHQSDKGLASTFSNPHPDNFEDLNKIYSRVYGKDIETPAEAHAAEAMYLMENQKGKQMSVLNRKRKDDYDNAQAEAMLAKRAANQKAQKDYAHALKKGSDSEWLENQVTDLETEAGKDPGNRIKVSGPTGEEKGLIMGAPAPVLKAFSSQGVEPDALIKYADGSYAPVFYKRDPTTFKILKRSDGAKLIDETITTTKMSRAQLKAAYGKAFATGQNLTGQFEGETEPEPSPTRQPKKTTSVIPKGNVR